jgi:hypothetical protein
MNTRLITICIVLLSSTVRAAWPAGLARYLAVAPRDESTSLQNLNFEL